jgi:hypothetical protein
VAAKAREARYGVGPTVQEVVPRFTVQIIGHLLTNPGQSYIDEEDMVREVLMALQGRDNIALPYANSHYAVSFDPT